MTEEEPVTPSRHAKKSFGDLLESRRSKMFGPYEVLALTVSCLLFFVVLFSYLYFLVPARKQLLAAKDDRSRLQANQIKLKTIVKEGQDTKATVNQITGSLVDFENVSLLKQDAGRLRLYGELNRLITKNGLRNTSGPTYTSLDPVGKRATPGTSISTKWQSVYPGIGILVTVEGPYQNLRNFVRDVERTRHFVIINQVELQRAENNAQLNAAPVGGSGSRASLVSLQLNMSTYFQRENGTIVGNSGQE